MALITKLNHFVPQSAEAVGFGHPDKICDQIADAILDATLIQDPQAKVACEVMASNRLILVGGEITTHGYVDVVQAAWGVLLKLGYHEHDFTIISNVNKQSEEINQAVVHDNTLAAGDQGIVYGYACDQTPQYLPLAYVLAQALVQQATNLIHQGKLNWAKHDMKALVNLTYQNYQPVLEQVVFSIQHSPRVQISKIREDIQKNVLDPIFKQYQLNNNYQSYINTSEKFVIGGPIADTGLTNRKLMVDSYGGIAHHGGGGFSGKDGTKVDRTGAYLARWIAKNLVAAGVSKQCEVMLTYALGLQEPLSLAITLDPNCEYDLQTVITAVNKVFPLNLNEVLALFQLNKPIFQQLSVFGHFGRPELNLPWEQLNKVDQIKALLMTKTQVEQVVEPTQEKHLVE